MRKLAAVEEARAIMKEGMEWGAWKWMLEKKKVREIADKARAALDELEMRIKETWSDELKIAYNRLVSEDSDSKQMRKKAKHGSKEGAPKVDSAILAAVTRVREADDLAYDAHEEAEDMFAEAEKRMSTGMAREGARKALEGYDRHEEAIRKAEALARAK
jgi:hypothetical protein